MLNNAHIKGITLIEVVIVTGIFTIGLGAMLTNSVGLFTTTAFSGDFLIASNLAREGIEITRNLRDENFLNGRAWNDGFEMNRALVKPLVPAGVFHGDFQLDEATYDMTTCVIVNKNCEVAYDPASGLYGDAGLVGAIPGAILTKFYRLLEFAPIFCGDTGLGVAGVDLCDVLLTDEQIGVKITSRVNWYQGPTLREAVMTAYLYNWDSE